MLDQNSEERDLGGNIFRGLLPVALAMVVRDDVDVEELVSEID